MCPTYLVAWLRPAASPGGEPRWEWTALENGRARVWLTLAAASQWAAMVAESKELGPTVVVQADRVPPSPGAQQTTDDVPHCRAIRLFELNDRGQAVAAPDLPGLDWLLLLIYDLYLPERTELREGATDAPE